ncbi:MAG: helix-turn-helix domain-containing protein [Candidatus Sericytochromatia bacterium]|nr:helix-turn-helix domain-containing protein [Candidatus Tanganyikabacteria bacterium]
MPSVSQILRQTREAKGITLDDVAHKTYIKLPYLIALEEGHIDQLLAPVFVYGNIRQYARLLGLNAEELVLQYQQEARREHPKLAAMPVLSTADADLVRIPVYAMAEAGNGNGNLRAGANGHAEPETGSVPADDVLQPITAAEVHLVERKVSMERPHPVAFQGSDKDVAAAQTEAQRIVAEAQREADRLRRDAEKYAFQVLSDLEAELGRTLAIIKNGRQYLQQRRRQRPDA